MLIFSVNLFIVNCIDIYCNMVKTYAVSMSQLYYLNKNKTTTAFQRNWHLFAQAHYEWRGFSRGLAILVVMGLEGATVLEVNVPFCLPIFVISKLNASIFFCPSTFLNIEEM